MTGLALAVDLLSQGPALSSKCLHSFTSISSAPAATCAKFAVSFIPFYPAFALQEIFRKQLHENVFCEEFTFLKETGETWIPTFDTEELSKKTYKVEPRPLFSAFKPRNLGVTIVRALLISYLPLLETYIQPEEDDSDDELDHFQKGPLNPIAPLKQSGTFILREVSTTTTRRVLERLLIHFVSDRIAWKLLKDVPESAARKAARNFTKWQLLFGVCRTTFRAHALGVAAGWLVQELLDIYRGIETVWGTKRSAEEHAKSVQDNLNAIVATRLARKTVGNTLKAGGCLIFASLGAGVGAVLISPSKGTWIGCGVGDFVGAFVVSIWLDPWILKPN